MQIPWKAQLFRFTAFLAEPASETDFEQLWLDAIGTEADQVNHQPKRQLQVFQTVTDRYQLNLQVERDRVDFLMRPPEQIPTDGVVEIGPFYQVSEEFHQLVAQWLNTMGWPTAYRLAIGAVLVIKTPDVVSARRAILDMLPSLNLDPAQDMEDLLFQVNRPRVHIVQGNKIRFNRLAKWAPVKVTETKIAFATGAINSNETHLASLELDMNTPGDSVIPYDAQMQKILVKYLGELALEISQQGDKGQ